MHDIDARRELLPEEAAQGDVFIDADFVRLIKFEEDVDVARLGRLSPRGRTEQRRTPHPPPNEFVARALQDGEGVFSGHCVMLAEACLDRRRRHK